MAVGVDGQHICEHTHFDRYLRLAQVNDASISAIAIQHRRNRLNAQRDRRTTGHCECDQDHDEGSSIACHCRRHALLFSDAEKCTLEFSGTKMILWWVKTRRPSPASSLRTSGVTLTILSSALRSMALETI